MDNIIASQAMESRIVERLVSLKPLIESCAANGRTVHVSVMSDMVESSKLNIAKFDMTSVPKINTTSLVVNVAVIGAGYPNQPMDDYLKHKKFWENLFNYSKLTIKSYGKSIELPF